MITVLPVITTTRTEFTVRELLFTYDAARRQLLCPSIGALDIDNIRGSHFRECLTGTGVQSLHVINVGVAGKRYCIEIGYDRFQKFIADIPPAPNKETKEVKHDQDTEPRTGPGAQRAS